MSSTTNWEKDEGGLPPVVLLPSIQHTGSRFVRWDILRRYQHCQLHEEPLAGSRTAYYAHLGSDRKPERFREFLPKYPAIAPLRHPRRVFKSWEKRGQSVKLCIEEWEFLINVVDPFNPYYMPVDAADRDKYLKRINDDLNVGFNLNWRPRGNDAGTMYMEPEAIILCDEADEYIESISSFTQRFWSKTVTETQKVEGVTFQNISSKHIDAYGYHFTPHGSENDSLKVKDQMLIEKFRLYDTLKAIEFSESTNVNSAKEAPRETSDVPFELLKSQAIAQGMKIDNRWGESRLHDEVRSYIASCDG